MESSPTHDVVATLGEYTNAQGEKKKRYHTVGKCFTDDQGRQSIKLEVIPGPGWSGWLSLYPVAKKEFQQPRDPRPAAPADDSDDNIPF